MVKKFPDAIATGIFTYESASDFYIQTSLVSFF
jgi:hypothetical protein